MPEGVEHLQGVEYLLRERKTRTCRLRRDDVDFLFSVHRSHLDVVPAGRRGWYHLTPRGHVGTILAPTCRLVIRPKIPLVNFFHLLDPTAPLCVWDDAALPVAGDNVLDFLAGRLAHLLEERTTAGLHRGYAERCAAGPFLLGRLDVPTQVYTPTARKDTLHGRFDDFTADVPCNQVPKAIAERLVLSSLLGESRRSALRHALLGFAGISPADLGPDCFAAAQPDRLTEAYRPLLDLCRLLWAGLAPGESSGPILSPAFLIDMERVFETYVARGLAAAFANHPHYQLVVQPLRLMNKPSSGQPDLHLRPDLLLQHKGQSKVIVDTKWKERTEGSLVSDDVYQVVTYCTALGASRGVLVYPGQRDGLETYHLAAAPLTLFIRTLRVTGSPAACSRSLHRLARALEFPAG